MHTRMCQYCGTEISVPMKKTKGDQYLRKTGWKIPQTKCTHTCPVCAQLSVEEQQRVLDKRIGWTLSDKEYIEWRRNRGY